MAYLRDELTALRAYGLVKQEFASHNVSSREPEHRSGY